MARKTRLRRHRRLGQEMVELLALVVGRRRVMRCLGCFDFELDVEARR